MSAGDQHNGPKFPPMPTDLLRSEEKTFTVSITPSMLSCNRCGQTFQHPAEHDCLGVLWAKVQYLETRLDMLTDRLSENESDPNG